MAIHVAILSWRSAPRRHIPVAIAGSTRHDGDMRIVAFYNNKGGIGKTTMAVHLALYAADRRIKTLLVGLDRQGDACRFLSGGECRLENGLTFRVGEYLWVTYSPMELPRIFKDFDLVIADCPPAIEVVDAVQADLWVVLLDGRFALENLANIHNDISAGDGKVMVVLNRCDMIGKRAFEALRKAAHKIPRATVRATPIPATGPIARTSEFFRPVWEVPNGEGTIGDRAIQSLCQDVLVSSGLGGRIG